MSARPRESSGSDASPFGAASHTIIRSGGSTIAAPYQIGSSSVFLARLGSGHPPPSSGKVHKALSHPERPNGKPRDIQMQGASRDRLDLSRGLPRRAGLGFRPQYMPQIIHSDADIGFFEVQAEAYMGRGGSSHAQLCALRERYALSRHGVGLSIGAAWPIDREHLNQLCRKRFGYEVTLQAGSCFRGSLNVPWPPF